MTTPQNHTPDPLSPRVDLEAIRVRARGTVASTKCKEWMHGLCPQVVNEEGCGCRCHARTDLNALLAEVARLQAENTAMREVVEAARRLIAAPVCRRGFMSFGHETCTPAGDGCDLHWRHMLKHTVSVLDAAAAESAQSKQKAPSP